jgi:DNA-binding response OmpR family regulator
MKTALDDLGLALERGDVASAQTAASTLKQELSAHTQIAAEVVHELRQPLVGIKAYAQLLGESVQGTQEPLSQLLAQVERMEQIISDYTRLATDKQAPKDLINLSGHIERARRFFALSPESALIQLEVELPEAAEIHGNGRLVEQLVLNLLNNAREAVSGKGRIRLSLRLEERAPILYVADWGPGIPAEMQKRIFEPYVTSKSRGSGLGLAVCRRIAQEHGAKIELCPPQTLPDGPSTVFRVAFPTSEVLPESRHRILVVDDEPIIRLLFRDMLSAEYDIVDVGTAEEALDELARSRFDLIISDQNLPGMSGLQLATEARRRDDSSRILLMTGRPTLPTAQQALQLGLLDYLLKPFEGLEQVSKKIRTALSEKPRAHHIPQNKRVDVYEDRPQLAAPIASALFELGMAPQLLRRPVAGGQEPPAAVLVSWELSFAPGVAGIELGRQMARGAPVIVVAEHLSMEMVLECLRGGASACLPRSAVDSAALSRELASALKA